MKIPKSIWILTALAVILIGARLVLLHYTTQHVNNVLASVQGYTCTAGDVDLYLYRGGFQVQEVYIYKAEGHRDIPLFYAPVVDISIEWNALLDEAVTSKVKIEDVQLNFIESDTSDQYGMGTDWAALLKELSPLRINQVDIVNGKFTYRDQNTTPLTSFTLYNFHGAIENLCHVADSASALPSSAHFTASSSDSSVLNVRVKFNARDSVPDLDAEVTFENIDMRSLNGFFNTYAQKEIEQGKFDLYTNMALLDTRVEGYIRYEATGLKVVPAAEQKSGASEAWQSIGTYLAANQRKEKLATRVPLAGSIREAQPGTWSALWQFYSDAFIKAFEQRKREGTIKLETVANEDSALTRKEEKQLKKEKRKERRKQKREERKKQKDL
jgi:hypothetical protein